MNAIQTYHTLLRKIEQTLSLNHVYRNINLAWVMTGILLSHSVHTSKIANKIPGAAKRVSRSRRISRFLNNRQLHPRKLYEPIACQLIQAAAVGGSIRLIIDSTRITSSHQLMMVALAYRKRALPLAWTWVRHPKGHSTATKQIALLSYVKTLIPFGTSVFLSGDSEFAPLQSKLLEWKWFFALRQKGNRLVQKQGSDQWEKIDSLQIKKGQKLWLADILLTKKQKYKSNLLIYWHKGESEPWIIATNLSSAKEPLKQYKIRMWIEEMFGDFKSNGADLEMSCLRHFQRLSRLTLAIALLYVWTVAFGSLIIKRGLRTLVDRADRRDLSIFRIGLDTFERYLINGKIVKLPDLPYFN